MSKYLISTCETYRVDNEREAKELIENVKKNTVGTMTKYSTVYKNQKQKGEIVQEWYRVTLTQEFNNEKEPDSTVDISYNSILGAFPDPIAKSLTDEVEEDE